MGAGTRGKGEKMAEGSSDRTDAAHRRSLGPMGKPGLSPSAGVGGESGPPPAPGLRSPTAPLKTTRPPANPSPPPGRLRTRRAPRNPPRGRPLARDTPGTHRPKATRGRRWPPPGRGGCRGRPRDAGPSAPPPSARRRPRPGPGAPPPSLPSPPAQGSGRRTAAAPSEERGGAHAPAGPADWPPPRKRDPRGGCHVSPPPAPPRDTPAPTPSPRLVQAGPTGSAHRGGSYAPREAGPAPPPQRGRRREVFAARPRLARVVGAATAGHGTADLQPPPPQRRHRPAPSPPQAADTARHRRKRHEKAEGRGLWSGAGAMQIAPPPAEVRGDEAFEGGVGLCRDSRCRAGRCR